MVAVEIGACDAVGGVAGGFFRCTLEEVVIGDDLPEGGFGVLVVEGAGDDVVRTVVADEHSIKTQ